MYRYITLTALFSKLKPLFIRQILLPICFGARWDGARREGAGEGGGEGKREGEGDGIDNSMEGKKKE